MNHHSFTMTRPRAWLPWCTAGLMAIALGTAFSARAQSPAWPTKPVRFINNFPPGGPSDILARSIGDALQTSLKQPFLVENRAGAGGNLGADAVAKSAADGSTVLFGIDTTFTVNPHIYKAMPFKPADLKPLMVMASSGLLLGVHPGTGIKSLKELAAAGKRKPLNFSSGGSGSPGHLAVEVLGDAMGIQVNHIPYKGNTPAVTAVLAGEVDGGVLATPGMLPHVRAGKITPLAVTSRQRSALAPELPTAQEAGIAGLELEVLYVAMVPASTPEPVMQAMQKAFAEALARPDLQARLQQLDMFQEGLTGAAAQRRINDLSTRYSRVIASTNMKVD